MPPPQLAPVVARAPLFPSVILLLVGLLAGPASARAAEAVVRVQIIPDAPSARITVLGPCRIIDLAGRTVVSTLPQLRWQEIRPRAEGIQVGRSVIRSRRVQIAPAGDWLIAVNGVRYRGALNIIRLDDSYLQLISEMPLEEYLKGVVPTEIDHRWPLETLKAQAIVARTFTRRQVADRAGHDFDVTKVWPQLYGGLPAERSRAAEAVEATRGRVLMFEGHLLPAYYHTVCGGHTEDASRVWPAIQQAPLRGVPCHYCQRAPHGHWRFEMSEEEVGQRLQRLGLGGRPVMGLTVVARDASGRVTTVAVESTQGTSCVSSVQLRAVLGPNRLRSTNFVIAHPDSRWVFQGSGWGHGVGLCQWGAARLGQQRQTAAQILAYYYPGAELVEWPRP